MASKNLQDIFAVVNAAMNALFVEYICVISLSEAVDAYGVKRRRRWGRRV